jgi:hypothetical protein
VGLEPTHPHGYQILSLARLPFRHFGFLSFRCRKFSLMKPIEGFWKKAPKGAYSLVQKSYQKILTTKSY